MTLEAKRALTEVFGDPANVSPGGTGAVLTSPAKLDFDIAVEMLAALPLDVILKDLGVVVAREYANELERRGLKPSNFAPVQGLSAKVSARIAKNIAKSEVFAQSFVDHLGMRGG